MSTAKKRSRGRTNVVVRVIAPSLNAKAVLQSTTDKFVLQFNEMEDRLVQTRVNLTKQAGKLDEVWK